jgi:hypothetical protein
LCGTTTADLDQQLLGSSAAKRVELGAHGRERRARILCLDDVVEANHRQLLRDTASAGLEELHRGNRAHIGSCGERGTGQPTLQQILYGMLATLLMDIDPIALGRVHANYQFRIGRNAAFSQGVTVAQVALLAPSIWAMIDVGDVLMAVIDQMQDGRAHAAAIIELDQRAIRSL